MKAKKYVVSFLSSAKKGIGQTLEQNLPDIADATRGTQGVLRSFRDTAKNTVTYSGQIMGMLVPKRTKKDQDFRKLKSKIASGKFKNDTDTNCLQCNYTGEYYPVQDLSDSNCLKEKEGYYLEIAEEITEIDIVRDIDKIIHSAGYTRYIDKTQVFSFRHLIFIYYALILVQI